MAAGTGGAHVVVGGASGIGAAVVGRARDAGDDIVVWDLTPAGADDVVCDIADPAAVDAAWAATLERVGVPDRVTISAGVGRGAPLVDLSVEAWDRVHAVNARGPFLVLRGLARAAIAASVSSSAVVIGSISGTVADQTMGAYCASKAAVEMVVRVAAAEWGAHGIRVNAVAPGVTRTPMLGPVPDSSAWLTGVRGRTPLGRLGTADDIAAAVVAVHALDWVTGQVLAADGGLGLHSPIDPTG